MDRVNQQTRCARRHYQNKNLYNLSQSENTKNNGVSNSIRNKIREILSQICFVYTVTFVWKKDNYAKDGGQGVIWPCSCSFYHDPLCH